MQEAHGRVLDVGYEQLGRGILTFVGCWPGFEFQAFNKYPWPHKQFGLAKAITQVSTRFQGVRPIIQSSIQFSV